MKILEFELFIKQASLNALLITFANSKPFDSKGAKGFVIESSYKASKYAPYPLTEEIYQLNNQLLSEFSGLDFQLNGTKHQFFIKSLFVTDEFFKHIYKQIQIKRIESQISDDEFSDLILLAFFAFRGLACAVQESVGARQPRVRARCPCVSGIRQESRV